MKTIVAAVLFSVAIIAGSWQLSTAWRKTHNVYEGISVTGSAQKDFTSDLIVWTGSFTSKSMNMQETYNRLKADAEKVRAYLLQKGIKEGEMVFSAADINKEYEYQYHNNGENTRIFTGYRLTQSVEIKSGEVDKVEKISREVTELIDAGVELMSQNPRYYYTKLADLKIEMIAAATADARKRAEQIAKGSGNDLGNLQLGDLGIFQITAQYSGEDYSWGGTYNTSSKEKTVTVTTHLEFEID